jgi:hypothetical protein
MTDAKEWLRGAAGPMFGARPTPRAAAAPWGNVEARAPRRTL